jgi:hypothetical protein
MGKDTKLSDQEPKEATRTVLNAQLLYIGPQPPPLISNVPNMIGAQHADEITDPGFIQFITDTVPGANGWWAPANKD